MDFEIKPSIVRVKMPDGQTYELKKLTLGQKRKIAEETETAYQAATSGSVSMTSTDLIVQTLKAMGLPEEAAMQLEEEQAADLIATLSGTKKNSTSSF